MKIQKKILTLMSTMFIIVIISLFFAKNADINHVKMISADKTKEKIKYIKQLLKLHGQPLKMLVSDYTFGDPMASPASNFDNRVVERDLNTCLKTYGINAIWVYNLEDSLIHSHYDTPGEMNFAFSREILNIQFSNNKFCHFFVEYGNQIMEIRGATIHPSSDRLRLMAPRGYFLAGKLWDTHYIKKLEELLGLEINIKELNDSILPDDSKEFFDVRVDTVYSGKNEPLRTIGVRLKIPIVITIRNIMNQHFNIMTIFIFAMITIFSLLFYYWIQAPLRILCDSLNNNDQLILKNLLKNRTEFGKLANLIYNSFEQKRKLKDEIDKRIKIELELIENKEKYKKLYENAEVALFTISAGDGVITECNDKFIELFEFRNKEEMLKKEKITDYFANRDFRDIFLKKLVQIGKVEKHEARFTKFKGTSFWARYSAYYYREMGVIDMVMLDISEEINAIGEIINSEYKYRSIFNTFYDVYFFLEMDGRIKTLSPSISKRLGYRPDELINKTPFQIFENPADYYAFMETLRSSNEINDFECKILSKEREIKYISINSHHVLNPQKKLIGIEGIIRDISHLKSMMDAIRDSETKFRTLAENSHDVITRFDREYRHLYVNPIVVELTGIPAEKYIGKTHQDLGLSEELCSTWEKSIEKVFETREKTSIEFQFSEEVWIDCQFFPEFSNDGKEITSVMTSTRDITKRKYLEESLKDKINRLQLLKKISDTFSSNLDLKRIVEIIYELLPEFLLVDSVKFFIYDPISESLIYRENLEDDSEEHESYHVKDTITISTLCFAKKKAIIIDNFSRTELMREKSDQTNKPISSIALPIIAKEKVYGVLRFNCLKSNYPGKTCDGEFFEMVGDQLSITIENALLFMEQIQANKALEESQRKLQSRNEIMEEDFANAQLIQRALLPRELPQNDFFKVDYRYVSLEAIGGDFFSFRKIAENKIGIFIGDVSGHGASAALFTIWLKATTDLVFQEHSTEPDKYMELLNKISKEYMESYYLTACYGILDCENKNKEVTFTFSKAGHPPPILFRKSTRKVRLVNTKGLPIGTFENPEYEKTILKLESGDRLYLYTDGVTEQRNSEGDIFAFQLPSMIERIDSGSLSEALDSITNDFQKFRGKIPISDDIAIIAFEIQ